MVFTLTLFLSEIPTGVIADVFSLSWLLGSSARIFECQTSKSSTIMGYDAVLSLSLANLGTA
jgi:hypothetical protein